MATITALVSAYYAEDYIGRRLDNMLSSKVAPEIIVVCQAGSTEHKIAQRYAVTTVATQDVPTIGKAWNIGIKLSSGEYLTTANTDDLWLPGGMEQLVKVLDDDPGVDLVFAANMKAEAGGIEKWNRYGAVSGVIDFPYELFSRRCIVGPMPVWRRSIHKSIGLFDETMTVACDYDMWLRMADAAMSLYYVPEPCGIYERRPDSLEHRNQSILQHENELVRSRYARGI
jgi:cellulose synthase/poly-beta-1,6-N-acetylglucosamine synthase-like glycosyltransferase